MDPRRALVPTLASALLLAAACGGAEPPRVRPPSPGPTTPPTPGPGLFTNGTQGDLASGEATVEVRGEARVGLTLRLAKPATYRPPAGGLLVNWTDDVGNVFGLGGVVFQGERRTSRDLSLTVVVAAGGGIYASVRGECEITIERADEEGFEGTFECEDVPGGPGRRIDATGRFSARAS